MARQKQDQLRNYYINSGKRSWQNVSGRRGKMWSNSGSTLKVEPVEFAEGSMWDVRRNGELFQSFWFEL